MDPPSLSAPKFLSTNSLPGRCMICDRSAHGFHCEVATCKGCKTFFRRQLLSGKVVECSLSKDCYDLLKRKEPLLRCQACRFKKCILVGMNPLALEFKTGEGNTYTISKIEQLKFAENIMQEFVEMLVHLDSKVEKFRRSAYNPDWKEIEKLEPLINSTNKLSLADNYEPFPNWPIVVNPLAKFQHNYFQKYQPDKKHWWFFNLLTSIEYIRTFWFFNTLDRRDQLVLMKHAAIGLTIFHISYFTIQNKQQYITQPDGSQHPHRTEPGYDKVSMLLDPLYRIEISNEEFLLLKAICVCNPAICGLSERAQVVLDKERCRVAKILQDFCFQNSNRGPSRFVELVGILGLVEVQQKKLRDIYLFSFGPLLAKLPKEFTISLIDDIFF